MITLKQIAKHAALALLLFVFIPNSYNANSNVAQNDSYGDFPQYFSHTPDVDTEMSGFPAGISGIAPSAINSNRYWMIDDRGRNFPEPYESLCRSVVVGDRSGGSITAGMHMFRRPADSISGGTLDLEDIDVIPDNSSATGSKIYISDVGDNAKNKPKRAIYVFDEPITPNGATDCNGAQDVQLFTFVYQNNLKHDVEAMFVDPLTKDVYLIVKNDAQGGTGGSVNFRYRRLYKISHTDYSSKLFLASANTFPASATANDLGFIFMNYSARADLKQVTGANMSQDGEFLVVSTYNEAFIWNLHSRSIDSIAVAHGTATQTFDAVMPIPKQTSSDVAEAIAFNSDRTKLIVAEEHNGPSTRRYYELPLANTLPTALNHEFDVEAWQSVTFDPLVGSADPDLDNVVLYDIQTPSEGSLVDNLNGTYTYFAPYFGDQSVQIEYTVADEFEPGVYYYHQTQTITFDITNPAALADIELSLLNQSPKWMFTNWVHTRSYVVKNLSGDTVDKVHLSFEWLNGSKAYLEEFYYEIDGGNFVQFDGDGILLEGLQFKPNDELQIRVRYSSVSDVPGDEINLNYEIAAYANAYDGDLANNRLVEALVVLNRDRSSGVDLFWHRLTESNEPMYYGFESSNIDADNQVQEAMPSVNRYNMFMPQNRQEIIDVDFTSELLAKFKSWINSGFY